MSTVTVSPLRQRMIEDMNDRKLCAGTQRGHVRGCKRFAAFLKQSPDTATAEDVRRKSTSQRMARYVMAAPTTAPARPAAAVMRLALRAAIRSRWAARRWPCSIASSTWLVSWTTATGRLVASGTGTGRFM